MNTRNRHIHSTLVVLLCFIAAPLSSAAQEPLSPKRSARPRHLFRHFTFAACCAFALCAPAVAQDAPITFMDPPAARASRPEATRIEVDEQANAVRIIIDGTERAVFDEDGLHLIGNIAYTGTITDISDGRLKANIRPLQEQAASLHALRPVTFSMTEDPDGRTEYGLIAQEVEPVYPALVETRPDGVKAVNYTGLIAPLIAAVHGLQAENARLRNRIEALESMTDRTPAETGAR